MKYSEILVTGGAGFIGSHVVDALMAKGCGVVVLDDFSTGKMGNIKRYYGDNDFRMVKGDVREIEDLRRVVGGVDAIIHMAAIVSVTRSINDPILVNEINTTGTLNLLKAGLDAGVERFIYPSSTAVYGDSDILPLREDQVPGPISPYGVSKFASEEYCRVFHRIHGMKTVVLRYFNVYGPGQRRGPYSGAITNFIYALLEGDLPVIYGDGEQTRDFIYVEDVVEASMLALENDNLAGETINVGTGGPTTINGLACTIIDLMGENGLKPVHDKPRPGDIRNNYADVSKAERILGFEAKVTLERGLRKMINHKNAG